MSQELLDRALALGAKAGQAKTDEEREEIMHEMAKVLPPLADIAFKATDEVIAALRGELENERAKTEQMKKALLPFTKFTVHENAKLKATRTITVTYKMLADARAAAGLAPDGSE